MRKNDLLQNNGTIFRILAVKESKALVIDCFKRNNTSEISSLQKQLMAYENDESEETRATIQKLKVSLEEAKEDLEETEYDQYIDDQKKLLDELYVEYEEILNQRIDDLEASFDEVIGTINDNSSGLIDLSSVLASIRNQPAGTTSNSFGDINITIPIDHVDGYNDFVNQLRDDRKFERMIQDMIVGRLSNGSRLAKNKYEW